MKTYRLVCPGPLGTNGEPTVIASMTIQAESDEAAAAQFREQVNPLLAGAVWTMTCVEERVVTISAE